MPCWRAQCHVPEIAIIAKETVSLSFQMLGERLFVSGKIVWMDAIEPIRSAAQFARREPNGVTNARRVVDFASFDIPVINTLIDGLHGQCVALLAVAERLFHLVTPTDVADRAHKTDRSACLIADRQAMIFNPAIVPVSRPDAVLALDLRRALLEAVPQRCPIALHIVGMNARVPICRCEPSPLKVENLHQAGRYEK
jgi:hypothetical protein